MTITITNSQSLIYTHHLNVVVFLTPTLGFLDLEVTIFRNLLSSKHAVLKKEFSQMWSRGDVP